MCSLNRHLNQLSWQSEKLSIYVEAGSAPSSNGLDFCSFSSNNPMPNRTPKRWIKLETRTWFCCLYFSQELVVLWFSLADSNTREKLAEALRKLTTSACNFTFLILAFSSWENHWLKRTFADVLCFSFCCNSVRWRRDRKVTRRPRKEKKREIISINQQHNIHNTQMD